MNINMINLQSMSITYLMCLINGYTSVINDLHIHGEVDRFGLEKDIKQFMMIVMSQAPTNYYEAKSKFDIAVDYSKELVAPEDNKGTNRPFPRNLVYLRSAINELYSFYRKPTRSKIAIV